MTDRMTCRATPGDLVVTTRGSIAGYRYRLRRAASVAVDGWVESTRALNGRDERLRAPDETIYLCALRADAIEVAAQVTRAASDIRELQRAFLPFRQD